ncbi:MAG: isoprenylcysteine carboxylmethyltransferase family protein [Chloroflexi bacterium]|nr:isoprenylcysteine carboxylmethyltransferase family protein [Chloroflexota bacterium]
MFIGIYQSATILLGIITFYIIDFVLITRYDKQRQAKGSGRSWGYTTMAIIVVIFIIVQPIALPQLSVHTKAWWGALTQVIGTMLIVSALIVQTWSRVHLRQFYAERVEVQPGHFVVDSGPYAHVRHPFFTSLFMFVIGLLLTNPALPTLLIAIYVFWDFPRAANQEEALLSKNLAGYADYMARVPRFFPRFHKQAGDN